MGRRSAVAFLGFLDAGSLWSKWPVASVSTAAAAWYGATCNHNGAQMYRGCDKLLRLLELQEKTCPLRKRTTVTRFCPTRFADAQLVMLANDWIIIFPIRLCNFFSLNTKAQNLVRHPPSGRSQICFWCKVLSICGNSWSILPILSHIIWSIGDKVGVYCRALRYALRQTKPGNLVIQLSVWLSSFLPRFKWLLLIPIHQK